MFFQTSKKHYKPGEKQAKTSWTDFQRNLGQISTQKRANLGQIFNYSIYTPTFPILCGTFFVRLSTQIQVPNFKKGAKDQGSEAPPPPKSLSFVVVLELTTEMGGYSRQAPLGVKSWGVIPNHESTKATTHVIICCMLFREKLKGKIVSALLHTISHFHTFHIFSHLIVLKIKALLNRI